MSARNRGKTCHCGDQWWNEARGDGEKNDNDSESVYVTQTHVRQAAVPISSLVIRFNQSKCSILSNYLVILVCVSQKGNISSKKHHNFDISGHLSSWLVRIQVGKLFNRCSVLSNSISGRHTSDRNMTALKGSTHQSLRQRLISHLCEREKLFFMLKNDSSLH